MDIDIEAAKHNPAAMFKRPEDILADQFLSREEKIDLLRRWAYDERELAVAEEENMVITNAEKHDNLLDDILKCLLKLGIEGDQDTPPPTKQG